MPMNLKGYTILCDLGKALDFNKFLKGLRPSILKNKKKECRDMHQAFWEAIHVERMLKQSRLQKAKMQEEKSSQTTEVPMVKPVMEIIKAKVEEQKQETNDFPTNSDEVIDKNPPPDASLGTLEDKEIDSLFITIDDKQVQALKEEKADFKELKVVNQEPNQLVDFIICSIPEEPIKSSKP